MGTEVVETRRRIIRRPRLTKLLDESPARIKLLIAPAGYGKTTLAREWLSDPDRQDVWYRGGPAAADVAALAAGLSVAASEVVPEAGKRMRERLRATGHPEEDVEILAELFAEDLQPWPENAWLAIDDYHFAMESTASERFVDLLTQLAPLQLVVTSRRRPTWATARRILYGELQEIDRRHLALDDLEAARVLNRDAESVVGLLTQAQGWPAVIGLAALIEGVQAPTTEVPDALYQYFAEEVLQSADAETRWDLARLALAETVDEDLARAVLGGRYMQTLREGTRLGVLVRERHTYLVHPLLRDFLQMELQLMPEECDETPVHAYVAQCLLDQERWDEAFDVADRFKDQPLAERVLTESLDPLLGDGRIATIIRWLDRGSFSHSGSAIFDFGEAEVAFRNAEHAKAEALAAGAALRLPDDHPLASRAFARAGRSAHIASRERESLEYFAEARKRARTTRDIREALVGLYFGASDLGLSEAATYLAELSDLDDG